MQQEFKRKAMRPAALPVQNGYGKVPPSDVEVEAAVLGALIIEKHVASQVFDRLGPESFYLEKHRYVFEAAVQLFQRNEAIDMLTVTSQLRKDGKLEMIGGISFLAELTNRVASSANVEYYAAILLEKQVLRGLMRLSSDILQQSSRDDADPFDLAEGLQKGAMELINAIARKEAKSVSALMPEYLKHLITISEKTPGLTGLPSGFANLDVRLGGFKPGKLYVVAGRPAMGKTAYVLNLLMNAAKLSKRPVAIFTLEMDDQETISRLLSTESGVDSKKITDGELDSAEWARINKATGALERVKFFIDDTSGLKMFELRAKARRLVAKEGVAMIAIDYLQLMSGDGKNHNREQQISEISRGLKTLAMELKIPVIALSQLSRSVESRGGDKRPQLQDLRESGSIEQDADTVSFLYRPEYYGIERKSDGSSTKGLVEVIHKKHRAGEPGTDQLYFRPNASLFTEFENQHGKEEMPF